MELRHVQDAMCEYLTGKAYRPVGSEAEADFALYILCNDSRWFSVYCDAIEFFDAQVIKAVCEPVSSRFRTDVIASSCFDSDFMFLNLINTVQNVDAWAKFGHDESKSFPRRNAYKPWTGKVSKLDTFKQLLKKQYVYAEEAWSGIEPLLEMSQNQGLFSEDTLDVYEPGQISTLFFASTGENKNSEPTELRIGAYNPEPCIMGQRRIITAFNHGGSSKGLAIAFTGSYVETGNISFHDVQFEYVSKSYQRKSIPLTLEKTKTTDGQWMYYATVPDFVIPERPTAGLPMRKVIEEHFKRSFGVCFTPEGNPRKRLDICIHFIPLSHQDGQCYWRVWSLYSSKKAYIDEYNEMQKGTNRKDVLLNADDFDDVM